MRVCFKLPMSAEMILFQFRDVETLAHKISQDSGSNLDESVLKQVLKSVSQTPISRDEGQGYSYLLTQLTVLAQWSLTPQRLDLLLCENAGIMPFLYEDTHNTTEVNTETYREYTGRFNRRYLGGDPTEFEKDEKKKMVKSLQYYLQSRILYGEYTNGEGNVYVDERPVEIRLMNTILTYTKLHPRNNVALFDPIDKDSLRRVGYLMSTTQFTDPEALCQVLTHVLKTNDLGVTIRPTGYEDDVFTPQRRTPDKATNFDQEVKPLVLARMRKIYQL